MSITAYEKISRAAPALVEQTLADHGIWNAVVFLLISHRLRQSDYEAWRLGGIACLEDAVIGNPRRILAMLDAALAHAQSMGLDSATITWTGWGKQAGKQLRLFRDDETNARFQIQLAPRPDRPQLDLFMDAPHTILMNRLRRALLDRDPEQDTIFDRALDDMPNEPALARLDTIRAAMKQKTADDAAVWFKHLDEAIAPAVMDEFNRRVMDIMAPLWRRVAGAMQDAPFDPEHGAPHASEAWFRAHAWESCLEAIESVSGWYRHACLHERRIAALSAMGNHDAVRQGWMAFCWLCPRDAAGALNRADLHACGLQRLWQQFSHMEPAQPVEDFPALMRLHGLHANPQRIAFEHAGRTQGWRHYQLVSDLLTHEKNGSVDVELRRSLREASPWLFQAYMARMRLPA